MHVTLLKLFYTLLTDPLGLPIEPLWEYVILLIVGEIVHEIAWSASPGGTFGSLIYWVTKLFAFVAIWAVLYAVIAAAQFVIAHWICFAIGAAILIAAGIAFATWNCVFDVCIICNGKSMFSAMGWFINEMELQKSDFALLVFAALRGSGDGLRGGRRKI